MADSNVLALEAVTPAGEVYERDVTWIRKADALIAEVSAPSHGVGYEIGFALNAGKPVLCIYQDGRKVSKMISGNPDPQLIVRSYKEPKEAINLTREFIKGLK